VSRINRRFAFSPVYVALQGLEMLALGEEFDADDLDIIESHRASALARLEGYDAEYADLGLPVVARVRKYRALEFELLDAVQARDVERGQRVLEALHAYEDEPYP